MEMTRILALFLMALLAVVIVAFLILIVALVYGGILVVTPFVAFLVGVEESTARTVAIVLVIAATIVALFIGFARAIGIR